jgi:hypothetical protein
MLMRVTDGEKDVQARNRKFMTSPTTAQSLSALQAERLKANG